MPYRGKQVAELIPTVSGREAAAIFGVSYPTFKRALDLYLHRKLRYKTASAGFTKRFVLVDVLGAAYPEASSHTVHVLAQNHVARFYDPRVYHARERGRINAAGQKAKKAAGG